jgi:hypothetical protein
MNNTVRATGKTVLITDFSTSHLIQCWSNSWNEMKRICICNISRVDIHNNPRASEMIGYDSVCKVLPCPKINKMLTRREISWFSCQSSNIWAHCFVECREPTPCSSFFEFVVIFTGAPFDCFRDGSGLNALKIKMRNEVAILI